MPWRKKIGRERSLISLMTKAALIPSVPSLANVPWWRRFASSLFGALLLHLTILFALAGYISTATEAAVFLYLAIAPLVSTLFALIISTGRKGGLIRRFWYGISLPAICYFLAANLVSFYFTLYESEQEESIRILQWAIIEELDNCTLMETDAETVKQCIDKAVRSLRRVQ